MKYGTTQEVEYQGNTYAISGVEYIDIEDKCQGIIDAKGISDEEKELAIEWVTYRALFEAGHFPSRPTEAEPLLAQVFSPQSDEKSEDEILDMPAESFQPAVREPVWTQSRILAEREKLLLRKQQLFKEEQKAAKLRADLTREANLYKQIKQKNAQTRLKFDPKIYNEDGSEWTFVDYLKCAFMLLIVFAIISALV